MPRVNADPDEIRRFANQLQNYIAHLQEETAAIYYAYNTVGSEWDDNKYAELGEALNEMRSQMNAFCDRAQEHIPHLHNMEARLREYQQS